jgi:hypothetical protein
MKYTADKDYNYSTDRTPAGNSGLAKKPNLWFIEQLCFLKTFVVADNFVQLNRLLRQAANRYTSYQKILLPGEIPLGAWSKPVFFYKNIVSL